MMRLEDVIKDMYKVELHSSVGSVKWKKKCLRMHPVQDWVVFLYAPIKHLA